MKYMLMFCGSPAAQEEWEAIPDEIRNEGYRRIGEWFGSHADKLVSTEELQSPTSATRVTFTDGVPVVTDGPYPEAKEVIGGYAVFDLEDRAAAVELARTWPGQGTVEIRPVVER